MLQGLVPHGLRSEEELEIGAAFELEDDTVPRQSRPVDGARRDGLVYSRDLQAISDVVQRDRLAPEAHPL